MAGSLAALLFGGIMTTLRLSKSKIGTFTLCPQKYQYTYVDKIIPEKTPKAMLEGSALHHVIENTIVYGDKIAEISRVASDEFWKDIELTGTEYESPEVMKNAQDSVLKEAETFLTQIDPLNPVDMETYFEYPLFNPETGEVHENILLRGYMDLIDCTDDGIYRVIDIKTSARTPFDWQADRSLELSTYAYLLASRFGWNSCIPVSYLYLVRTKNPKVVWLNSARSRKDFQQTYSMLLSISQAILQGNFYKNIGMHCSWCQHQDICFHSNP